MQVVYLFIKVHSLQVRLIAREDLVGLWDDPDLAGRELGMLGYARQGLETW
jgi:hypothetical protein